MAVNPATVATEIKALLASVATFKSVECGRIRETVTVAQMPALDIVCGDPAPKHYAKYTEYTVPVIMQIRAQGYKRKTGADAVSALVTECVQALESSGIGTSYDVLRDIAGGIRNVETGNGSPIITAVITGKALKG